MTCSFYAPERSRTSANPAPETGALSTELQAPEKRYFKTALNIIYHNPLFSNQKINILISGFTSRAVSAKISYMDERINKFLSGAGFCSRREADRLVAEGRVTVGGEIAVPGTKVKDKDKVLVDGREVACAAERRVFALYKPAGYISSLSDSQGEGISCFIHEKTRLYPVGRLDKDSEGLMLLTNDGALMNEILKASGGHEKEYLVSVDKRVTARFLKAMERGVPVTNGATGQKITTAPCRTEQTGEYEFKITLTQGLNRQIRRMCGCFGYKVVKLRRIRIMNITLEGLSPGQMRELLGAELERLRGMTGHGQNSEN